MSNEIRPGDVFKLLRRRRYDREDVYFVVVEPCYKMSNSWTMHQIGNITADFLLVTWERADALLNPVSYERVI